MAQTFQYEAKNQKGQVIQGTLRAQSEEFVFQQLSQKGYFPLSIHAQKNSGKTGKKFFSGKMSLQLYLRRVAAREKANFFDQMSLLLASGFPLLKSMELVRRQIRNPELTATLEAVSKEIQTGAKLSEAAAKHPEIFTPAVTGAMQAGEASGKLETIFQDLAAAFAAEADFKAKVTQALVYPIFLIFFMCLTVIAIFTFVIPKLMVFFDTWETALPLPTRMVMAFGQLFSHGAGLAIIALMIVSVVYWKRLDRQKKAAWINRLGFKKIPLLRSLFFLLDFVPLARTWAMLLRSGVPLLEAIQTSKNVIVDPEFRSAIDKTAKQVSQGRTLRESLEETHVFPELALNFLSVGEESGNLDIVFERMTAFYERELDRRMQIFLALLGPLLILVIGIIVGFIVISMLLPIFQINLMAS